MDSSGRASMIHSLSKTFHTVKFSFLFLTCALLSNSFAPNAIAQSTQPAAAAPPQTTQLVAQAESKRKTKVNTPPEYPELARKLNIEGMARVLAVLSADGNVSKVKELGGNPILVTALADAVKSWKYEPAEHESMVEIRFEFVQKH
jgi:TonB family protein